MIDIEPFSFDWIDYGYWCIDSYGLKIYFDTKEFYDNSLNKFYDHIPNK